MVRTENFEQVEVASAEELRRWLEANHGRPEGVWLVTYKKQVVGKYVSVQEVLDELLCFGWIDGLRRKLDAERTMQLITPRRAEHWAKTYQERFARLEAEGRMAEPGRAAARRAQESGQWSATEDVDQLLIPDDLMEALLRQAPALDNFRAFAPSSQRFTLRWIKLARTAPTRARRIAEAARLAAENRKIPGL